MIIDWTGRSGPICLNLRDSIFSLQGAGLRVSAVGKQSRLWSSVDLAWFFPRREAQKKISDFFCKTCKL